MISHAPRPPLVRLAFVLLWIFVFSIPGEKSIEIEGVGTISRLAGAVAMAGALLAVFTEMRIRVPGAVHVALAAFVLWSAITVRWSLAPVSTEERVASYVQLLGLIWLVWELCPREAQVLGLLDAYVIGALAPVLNAMHRFLLGSQTYYHRYAAEGFEPNDLALTLALSLPMSYYLSLSRRGWVCWLYRAQMILVCGAILLTASRGGSIAMTVALGIVFWTLPILPPRGRLAVAGTVAVAVCAAAFAVPATSWRRLATVTSEVTEGTLNSRTVLWEAGWRAFGDTPFIGVGSGAYPELLAPLLGRPSDFTPVAHNTFISVAVETGLVGFACFAAALVMLASMATRLPGITARFWLIELAVWAVGVFSLSWEFRKPTWLIFGLLAAHSAALMRMTERHPRRWEPLRLQLAQLVEGRLP